MRRRDLLSMAGACGLAVGSPQAAGATSALQGLRRFDVRAFGAAGDAKKLDSPAINAAIDACNGSGGGVTYVPPGEYRCGTVVLKSNVTLYLEAGATILGSSDLADYTAQTGEQAESDLSAQHLLFARDAENAGLAGPGRIDGQGPKFWVPSGRAPLPPEESWRDVAQYDWKPLPRPSPMLQFVGCRHLRVDDVRIENSPAWTLCFVNCDHVGIRGISVKNPVYGPNADGMDLMGCQNVRVEGCDLQTADDAICLKSESAYGSGPRLSKNIVITNCLISTGCNGLKFGTWSHGGFENVTFSNSVIYNEDVNPRERVIAGLALEIVDGGWMEGVVIFNIRMQRVRTPIFIRRGNRTPRSDGAPGSLRGVMIENVHATGAIMTSSITGLPGFDVEDVTLSGIRIASEETGKKEWVGREIPEVPAAYPEARMFGHLPAFGFYCRHVSGLRLRDLTLTGTPAEERPAIACDDVKDLDIRSLRTTKAASTEPVVRLIQTVGARLTDCTAPDGSAVFLAAQGDRTRRVVLAACDLSGAQKPVDLGPELSPDAVSLPKDDRKL